jgi:hypothetical protein
MAEGTAAWIWTMNMLGSSAFGIIMPCLFFGLSFAPGALEAAERL